MHAWHVGITPLHVHIGQHHVPRTYPLINCGLYSLICQPTKFTLKAVNLAAEIALYHATPIEICYAHSMST